MSSAARLLSVNVGLPKEIAWRGRTVRTGIWKAPVAGRRRVRRLNIDGDGQGDLIGHGGEQRAVLVYQTDSYRYWENRLQRGDFTLGQFGENFTVEGLPDDEVCIGDRYRIGGALLEVTQPRVTCYRVGIRMDEPRMAALLVSSERPGFYLRVLEEGEVGAGDEIVKVAAGPEGMTVRQANALLYLPGHPRAELERALRIPALSPGWRGSFRTLLEQATQDPAGAGNPGLAPELGPPAAWSGFRRLEVRAKRRESEGVISLNLASAQCDPLTLPEAGQFVVLRLTPDPRAAPLLRSYSLAGAPGTSTYRIGVKREAHGLASAYLHDRVQVGDPLEVSAPRGNFILHEGTEALVLLSAGIGITPVLAILHALAAARSTRPVYWIHGARDERHHPFAAEARRLLARLPHATAHVQYSRAHGRVTMRLLEDLGLPRDGQFYLCGPAGFLRDLNSGLLAYGVAADHVHAEVFGPGEAGTPGLVNVVARAPHSLDAAAGEARVSFARSGVAAGWRRGYRSLLELAEACDVPVRWSCRTGVCHRCEAGLVAGTVNYDPQPLEPPAPGNLLTCCAQPASDVVIDL
jgi:ferredoxin-NADP reductase/MOSC domain-containing protein YiiM/ferredoxin